MKPPAKSATVKKPTPIHWAAGSAGFLAMACLGWSLAGGSAARHSTTTATPAPEKTIRDARAVRSHRGPTGPAARQLQLIRLARDPNERARAIVDLANQLSPAEFGEWMENGWFNIRGGEGQTLFTKILEERWKQEDPEGLLVWSIKNESGAAYDIIASWAGTEPRRVLDFFRAHPDPERELEILAGVAEKNPALALQRFQELSAEGLSKDHSGYAASLMRELAKQSPAALEAVIQSLSGPLKLQAETALVGERIKTSYTEELHKLFERPDGLNLYRRIFSNGEVPDEVKAKLFDELANLPPTWRTAMATGPYYFMSGTNASKWVETDLSQYGFTGTQISAIHSRAISYIGSKEPVNAIRMMADLDLSPEYRESILRNIFQYQRRDKEQTEAMLAALASGEDRQMALGFISSSGNSGNSESEQPKIEKPQDWIAAATALDTSKGHSYEFYSTLQKWDGARLDALAAQFKSMPEESKRKVAQVIADNPYSSAPGPLNAEAIRYLIANPAPPEVPEPGGSAEEASREAAEKTIGLASQYVSKIARTDPDGAAEWVQGLPDGDARMWAMRNLHSLWSQYDPKAANQWKNSLPPKVRADVDGLKSRFDN